MTEENKNTDKKLHTDEGYLPLPSDMQRSFGPVIRWFFNHFFKYVEFSDEDRQVIKDCADKGTVIYIMRSRSFIAFLFFNYSFLKFGLPLARFVNNLSTKFFMSIRKLREYRARKIPGFTGSNFEEETRLNYLTREKESSLLFLLPPPKHFRLKKRVLANYLETLIDVQQKTDGAIFLVPMVFLYTKKPENDPPSLFDILFRMRDNPSWIRDLLTFIWSHREAKVRVSEPVNLREYLDKNTDIDKEVTARKLRTALIYHLRREQEVVTGPARMRPATIKKLVLQDKILAAKIKELAGGNPKEEAKLRKKAEKKLEKIAADLDINHIALLNWALIKVWNIMKMVVRFRRSQINPLRSYARKAPLVFCPAHRSHIDYLVLSQILYTCDFVPPHIAAGENLSFWPMGYIFHKTGAFFMRRRFKGAPLYSAVFNAYIRRLLRGHHSIEFFLEGGRSRSGKMLRPKTGLLAMIYNAYLDGACDDIYFVPIYSMYEKLPESGSYASELVGAQKKKETLGALVRSSKFLAKRFGKVDVRFGTPLSLKDFLKERGIDISKSTKEDTHKTVSALGYAISYEINEQASVNAAFLLAVALLESRDTSLSFEQIIERAKFLIDNLSKAPARLSGGLKDDLEMRIREAIGLHIAENNINVSNGLYAATPKGRLALDYHRNSSLHYFVPQIIAATTMLSFDEQKVKATDVFMRAKEVRDILKNEFIFKVGRGFEEASEFVLNWAIEKGHISQEGDYVIIENIKNSELNMLRSAIVPFTDAYILATRTIADIEFKALYRADFVKRAVERGAEIITSNGEISPEACTKTTLTNAVEVLKEYGFIEEVKETNDNPKGGILIPTEKGRKIEERQKFCDYLNETTGRPKPEFANITMPLHPLAGTIIKDD